MKLYLAERPSAPMSACAIVPVPAIEAHANAVGITAAPGAPIARMWQESVQAQRTQGQVHLAWGLSTDSRMNGFAAKATGNGMSLADTGVKARGVPPRGKPV